MASRELKVEIIGDASSLQKALGSVDKSGSKLSSGLLKLGKAAAVGLGALGVGAVVAGKEMVSLASDAEEVQSKMTVVFGKELPGLTKNLDKFSEATGASKFQLREQAADMGALLVPLTANKAAAADMSQQFVQLATDLGSFNNVPVEEALLAIRSGLVGEAEPLRRFGVLLNEGAVKAEAYSSGIAKSGAELSEQQKVQARANLIMEQTTLAQGDATRTSGSMANQLKALKNNLTDAATEMGMKLLPAVLGVVRAFNENWPQISRIVDQVMDLLITGASAAANAVKTHFNTIKTVATTAFQGALDAGRALVNFLRSDVGQQVAIGAGAFLGLSKAIGGIMAASKLANTGLLLIKANPLWAALIPLSFALGAVAENFIKSKIEAANAAAAWDAALDAANRLKGALSGVEGAQISVRQATLDARNAHAEHVTSITASKDALLKYGPNSAQYRASLEAEEQASINADSANLRLRDSKALLIEKTGELEGISRSGAAAIASMAGTMDKASGSSIKSAQLTGLQREESDAYIKKLNELIPRQQAIADKYRTSEPAISRQAELTAELGRKLVKLTDDTNKVPSNKKIIAEAKLLGGPKFAQAVQGIIDGSDNAQKGAKKQLDKIPGHVDTAIAAGKAEAAGASGIATAITSGIESGFDFGGIISIVRRGVQAAIEAGKNAGSTTKDAAKPIGHALVEGPVEGVKEKTPELEKVTVESVRKAVGAARLAAAANDIGAGAVQKIINDLVGKTPSLRAQFNEMWNQLKIDAAAKAKELAEAVKTAKANWASAFSELARAGMDAIAAKFANWENPIRKALDAEQAARSLKQLETAVTDTANATRQAVDAAVAANAEYNRLASVAAQMAAGVAVGEITGLTEEEKQKLAGMSPEEAKKFVEDRVAAANEAQTTAYNAEVAARKAHDDAIFALHVETETRRANDLDARRAARMKAEQDEFSARITRIGKQFNKEKPAWDTLQKKLMDLFKDYGIKLGGEFGKGIKDGLVQVGSAVDELATAIANKLKGSGGGGGDKGKARGGLVRRGQTYLVGEEGPEMFRATMSGRIFSNAQTRAQMRAWLGTASNEQMWKDLLASAREKEGIPGVGDIAFGGVPEVSRGFELGFTPAWADPEIWDSTTRLAKNLGKLDEFLQAVGSGSFRSNAGLLEGLKSNRTRWNWNDPLFTPRIVRMLEMMYGGMTGSEVAGYFGLMAKGGIVTRPGLAMIGEAGPEAVIPLKRGMGSKVELHIHGDVLDVDRWAEKMAQPIESALARRKSRTGPLAFA